MILLLFEAFNKKILRLVVKYFIIECNPIGISFDQYNIRLLLIEISLYSRVGAYWDRTCLSFVLVECHVGVRFVGIVIASSRGRSRKGFYKTRGFT